MFFSRSDPPSLGLQVYLAWCLLSMCTIIPMFANMMKKRRSIPISHLWQTKLCWDIHIVLKDFSAISNCYWAGYEMFVNTHGSEANFKSEKSLFLQDFARSQTRFLAPGNTAPIYIAGPSKAILWPRRSITFFSVLVRGSSNIAGFISLLYWP